MDYRLEAFIAAAESYPNTGPNAASLTYMMQATAPSLAGLYTKFDVPVELDLLTESEENVKAHVYRVSAGLVELSSPVYVPADKELEIVSEGRRIRAIVVYCRDEANGTYDVALRIGPDSYLRTEPRVPVDLTTKLQILGSPTPIPIRVVDLSPSGIGLETPIPVTVGSRAVVSLGHSTVMGEIRHCARSGMHYRAGIRIEKLVRAKDAYARVWTDLNSRFDNTSALAAFEKSVVERQAISTEALLSILEADQDL